jgi:hypothetical protein
MLQIGEEIVKYFTLFLKPWPCAGFLMGRASRRDSLVSVWLGLPALMKVGPSKTGGLWPSRPDSYQPAMEGD